MKTLLKRMLIMTFLTGGFFFNAVYGDPPSNPPPPPEGGHGSGSNQLPAGAPIDGGLGFLLVLGAAYGVRKLCPGINRNDKKV